MIWTISLLLYTGSLRVLAQLSASCLGQPEDCYGFLPSAPRGAQYWSTAGVTDKQIANFLDDPDVCTVDKLYKIHAKLEIRTLAGLQGGVSQARFEGAADQVDKFLTWCRWSQTFMVALNKEAADYSEFRKYMLSIVNEYYSQAGTIFEEFPRSADELDEKYPRSIATLITEYTHKFVDSVEPAEPRSKIDVQEMGIKLALLLRQAVENFRMLLGVKTTMREIASLHPWLKQDINRLPRITFHNEIYGRHWDVIEALIASRGVNFFVEIGVALGAVGLVSLDRFPGLRYLGIDPSIRSETQEIFQQHVDRAQLIQAKSSEVVQGVPDRSAGLVFIDGPHTYAQVSTDISEWMSKVKAVGWLAGHDFSAQHPPLVWAVLEQALVHGIKDIHVGMDGVWWWDSAEWVTERATVESEEA